MSKLRGQTSILPGNGKLTPIYAQKNGQGKTLEVLLKIKPPSEDGGAKHSDIRQAALREEACRYYMIFFLMHTSMVRVES
jgi:hypothetical protein